MQLYSHGISWASDASWESSPAAVCSQRRCCLPTINWAASGLLSPAKMNLRCLFVPPPTHSAPWCSHLAAHMRRAAGQVYGQNLVLRKRRNHSLGWPPDSILCSTMLSAEQSACASTCLPLPCCFLQACKSAKVYTLAPLGKAAYLLLCLFRISPGAR